MPSHFTTVSVIGGGPPMLLAILALSVAGVVLWSREHPPQELRVPDDVPVRLLRWSVALLPADRVEWGQAMLGELDRLDGRAQRRRFAVGCVASVVLLPPWGLVAPMAALGALGALALGSAVVFGIGFAHFGLATNPWNWVLLIILATLMLSAVFGVSVQLRRPRVAMLGLAGGLFVAAAWLVASRLTYTGLISPINSVGSWWGLVLMIAVPLVVGTIGAWVSGSASVGRRAARLAGVSAGLAMFFASTIAVLAIDGGPRDPGASVGRGVSEAFFEVAMLFLFVLPVATTLVGWVAATATARIRFGGLAQPPHGSMGAATMVGPAAVKDQTRTNTLVLRRVVVTVVVVAALLLLKVA